jgi:chemotaxis protein CheC
MHVDVLKELGNIGSGNAFTALSSLIGKPISIAAPSVKILNFDDSARLLGGAENIVSGVLVQFHKDIHGMILYIFASEFAQAVMQNFFGKTLDTIVNMDEMDKSALSEIGNIMASSYAGAISAMSGLEIGLSVPSICVDMAGAILSVPAIEFSEIGDKVLFIDNSFGIGESKAKSTMILVPEMDSLNLLFSKLGVQST